MRKAFKIAILAVALLCILLFIYFKFAGSDEQVTYLTEKVIKGDIVQTVNATGDIAAQQLVSVGAQVSGQVKRLYVHLGQQVNKGDMVAEIDDLTQVNELDINKAKLDTYKAQLVSRQITLKVAQKQYDREVTLFKQNATSHENLENAEDALAAAKAAVNELQSLIKQTQIAVNTSEVNLGYTKISAPLTGTVLSLHVEEGQTVNANQTTPTIVQIADLSQMEIKLQISEGDVTKVKPGMPVSYSILSEPGVMYETTLQSVDPGLTTLTDKSYDTSSSSSSGSSSTAVYYYGKLVASNPQGKLRIGMTVQSTITVASARHVLIVPSIAIHQADGQVYVNLMQKDGGIVEKVIETGISDNMNTEVISGLNEGDVVISSQMTAGEISGSMGSRMRAPRL